MSAALMVILICLVGIGAMVSTGVCLQYRRYRGKYQVIARSLCDPGTWRISFHVRTLLLTGRVDGRVMRYSVFGDERGKGQVSSYLLLEWPVKRNFRFYSGGDLDLVDPEARESVALLAEMPGFQGLLLASPETPRLATLIARPLGFGRAPGLLLWKWGDDAFNPDTIKDDFLLLSQLATHGI
jgi:hypothetical protein